MDLLTRVMKGLGKLSEMIKRFSPQKKRQGYNVHIVLTKGKKQHDPLIQVNCFYQQCTRR